MMNIKNVSSVFKDNVPGYEESDDDQSEDNDYDTAKNKLTGLNDVNFDEKIMGGINAKNFLDGKLPEISGVGAYTNRLDNLLKHNTSSSKTKSGLLSGLGLNAGPSMSESNFDKMINETKSNLKKNHNPFQGLETMSSLKINGIGKGFNNSMKGMFNMNPVKNSKSTNKKNIDDGINKINSYLGIGVSNVNSNMKQSKSFSQNILKDTKSKNQEVDFNNKINNAFSMNNQGQVNTNVPGLNSNLMGTQNFDSKINMLLGKTTNDTRISKSQVNAINPMDKINQFMGLNSTGINTEGIHKAKSASNTGIDVVSRILGESKFAMVQNKSGVNDSMNKINMMLGQNIGNVKHKSNVLSAMADNTFDITKFTGLSGAVARSKDDKIRNILGYIGNPEHTAKNRMHQQKGLSMFGDFDGDGVPNILDCNPVNKWLQDEAQDNLTNYTGGKEPVENEMIYDTTDYNTDYDQKRKEEVYATELDKEPSEPDAEVLAVQKQFVEGLDSYDVEGVTPFTAIVPYEGTQTQKQISYLNTEEPIMAEESDTVTYTPEGFNMGNTIYNYTGGTGVNEFISSTQSPTTETKVDEVLGSEGPKSSFADKLKSFTSSAGTVIGSAAKAGFSNLKSNLGQGLTEVGHGLANYTGVPIKSKSKSSISSTVEQTQESSRLQKELVVKEQEINEIKKKLMKNTTLISQESDPKTRDQLTKTNQELRLTLRQLEQDKNKTYEQFKNLGTKDKTTQFSEKKLESYDIPKLKMEHDLQMRAMSIKEQAGQRALWETKLKAGENMLGSLIGPSGKNITSNTANLVGVNKSGSMVGTPSMLTGSTGASSANMMQSLGTSFNPNYYFGAKVADTVGLSPSMAGQQSSFVDKVRDSIGRETPEQQILRKREEERALALERLQSSGMSPAIGGPNVVRPMVVVPQSVSQLQPMSQSQVPYAAYTQAPNMPQYSPYQSQQYQQPNQGQYRLQQINAGGSGGSNYNTPGYSYEKYLAENRDKIKYPRGPYKKKNR